MARFSNDVLNICRDELKSQGVRKSYIGPVAPYEALVELGEATREVYLSVPVVIYKPVNK